MADPTADELRNAFRAIPKDQRDTHQPFAIRVWRGLSWLERAQQASEVEDRFISSWISFNALYGRLGPENRAWGDREAMGSFLTAIWNLDDEGQIRRVLCKRQLPVLRLVETKYLYDRFWSDSAVDHTHELHQIIRDLLPRFGKGNMLPVLRALFDRLYVMRNQVFHGASTKGSSLNRRTLAQSASLLTEILPVMIRVLIEQGIEHDWGNVCFPPIRERRA